MSALRSEIIERFPEVQDALDEEDGDYTLMHRVIEWLRAIPREEISADLADRVLRFQAWCEAQPRSDDPGEDMWTIFIVGFYEHLFQNDSTRALIPKLMSRDQVTANREYLVSWIGESDYQKALREYDAAV